MEQAEVCENCGAALVGPYCHDCGQEAEGPPESALRFVLHQVSDLVGLNSKAARSFWLLVTRPGLLTEAYSQGKRVSFTAPLQIYLVAATVFVLVQAYLPLVRVDVERWVVRAVLASVGATPPLPSDLPEKLQQAGVSPEVFAERFETAVVGYLTLLLLSLLVAFAVWLKVLFRTRPFALHAIFSLHWASFFLLLEGVRRITPLPSGWGVPVAVLMSVVSLGYLTVGLRRVYEGGWVGSAIKALLSLVFYYVLVSVWLNSTIALGVLLV